MNPAEILFRNVAHDPDQIAKIAKAELRAMRKLQTHVDEYQYAQYVITGTFLEVSERTNLKYLLRKGFPILVFTSEPQRFKFVIGLCVHMGKGKPGYWRGELCPTDDVIAQLLYIRHAEDVLWSKAAKHTIESEMIGI
jgi:hypothetical protein